MPSIIQFFDDQQKRCQQKLAELFPEFKSIKAVDDASLSLIFDIHYENEALIKATKPLHTSGVQRSIKTVNKITGSDTDDSISNPKVHNAIAKLGAKAIVINQTTRQQVDDIITQGIIDGASLAELTSEIDGIFNEGWRSRMIARTESANAYREGSYVSYRDLGVQTYDVIGCIGTSENAPYGTQDEDPSTTQCGEAGHDINELPNAYYHPNHSGCEVPTQEEGFNFTP